jgi:hypothetical protein
LCQLCYGGSSVINNTGKKQEYRRRVSRQWVGAVRPSVRRGISLAHGAHIEAGC